MASKISVQNVKISIDFSSATCHFAASESYGITAARFVATGFSKSTVPYGFKYKIRIKSRLLTSPVNAACEVIANEVPKSLSAQTSKLYAPHITRATTNMKTIGPHTPTAHVKIGVIFAPPSICCSFCSADMFAERGLFSICWVMNCRQLIRWLIANVTPMLNTVSRTNGSTQLGLRTMSSKVGLGEKNTPKTRPTGLIPGCDCASGAATEVVAAIRVPPPQSA